MNYRLPFAAAALVLAADAFAPETGGEPRLLSVFPSAGSRMTAAPVELRGNALEEVAGTWLSRSGLTVKFTGPPRLDATVGGKPSPSADGKTPPPVYVIPAIVEVNAHAEPGAHWIRVISPRGVSNAVRFDVVAAKVVTEEAALKAGLPEPPALINGRIAKAGEADRFIFHAREGERLSFRVAAAENFGPRLALLGSKTSWLDSRRAHRVLFDEERSFELMPLRAEGTLRVPETGRYALEVSSLFGKGCPECSYQLSVAREGRTATAQAPAEPQWRERTFTRALGHDWMNAIEARRGGTSAQRPSEAKDTEPNDSHAQATRLTLPALIEGKVDRPGDVDHYRFHVESGSRLTFEIETPDTPPPHFNPRISVLDANGKQLFSNIQRRISLFNNNAEQEVYLADIQPRATHTFTAEGDHVLQVRDLTSRYGGPGFAYRILVRQQVPHTGEVTGMDLDRVNLARGTATKVTVTAMLEEGFQGDVTFHADGLPAGVTMSPAGRRIEERAPRDLPENAETVLPVMYPATLVFSATADTPLSREPARVTLECRPLVDGVPGAPLKVREFPLMVVAPQAKEAKR